MESVVWGFTLFNIGLMEHMKFFEVINIETIKNFRNDIYLKILEYTE